MPELKSLLCSLFTLTLLTGAAVDAAGPDDPYYAAKGSWGQSYDDQWGLKRVGFTDDARSAWNLVDRQKATEVIVAVIDTGLDWNHQDMSWDNIWKNADEIPDNGIDDDDNGYADDIIGWNFYGNDNQPWDRDGHGTFVAGLIAATRDNQAGIAGVSPHARIMVLKALNNFGHTRASYLARAIQYAADNGARVINMSIGGKEVTHLESAAMEYARGKGALIVVSAGNEGINTDSYGPASFPSALTVAATDVEDKHASFSNWGRAVDIAAPGVDILSLRARRTDLMFGVGEAYQLGEAFVGEDKRYFRTSGTSFSAPLVAATASLIWSRQPGLSLEQVERMLLHSARDIDEPGVDMRTGYGLLDAEAALSADPEFFIETRISGVAVVAKGGEQYVEVSGTANADQIKRAWLELGKGKNPKKWKQVAAQLKRPVIGAALGAIKATEFAGSLTWIIRVIAEHGNGKRREARFLLTLG